MNLLNRLQATYIYERDICNVHCVVTQILQCLSSMHKINLIHCDLKPENLLVVSARKLQYPEIRVADFGNSLFADDSNASYRQTRFYRAPEVILRVQTKTPVDIWSLGCVAAELWTKQPLFSGRDSSDQLWAIMEVLGPPPKEFIIGNTRGMEMIDPCKFEDLKKGYRYTNSSGLVRVVESRSLNTIFGTPDVPEEFFEFLTKSLKWVPEERITVEQALKSKFIQRNFDIMMEKLKNPKHKMSLDQSWFIDSKNSNELRTAKKFLLQPEMDCPCRHVNPLPPLYIPCLSPEKNKSNNANSAFSNGKVEKKKDSRRHKKTKKSLNKHQNTQRRRRRSKTNSKSVKPRKKR